MTRLRVAAAVASMLTALLLQATVVTPLALSTAASLPAVLVAAVALAEGPAAGLSFGFALGLITDLGSRHPAGVLALCWLVLGIAAGAVSARRSVRMDAALAAVLCTVAALASGTLVLVLHADGATLGGLVRGALPTAVVDLLLAVPVVALTRAALRNDALTAPRPVGDLVLAGRRA